MRRFERLNEERRRTAIRARMLDTFVYSIHSFAVVVSTGVMLLMASRGMIEGIVHRRRLRAVHVLPLVYVRVSVVPGHVRGRLQAAGGRDRPAGELAAGGTDRCDRRARPCLPVPGGRRLAARARRWTAPRASDRCSDKRSRGSRCASWRCAG